MFRIRKETGFSVRTFISQNLPILIVDGQLPYHRRAESLESLEKKPCALRSMLNDEALIRVK